MEFKDILAIVKSVLTEKYCEFEGRSTRPEFWWFYLFNCIVGIILGLFGSKVGVILSSIWSLATLLPILGLGVRRLHDINKSGWYYLLAFIPVVGAIILILWWAKPGDAGENQYGPVPETPKAE